jgi:hypothetical protein
VIRWRFSASGRNFAYSAFACFRRGDRVGVFPEGEEILTGRHSFGTVALHGIGCLAKCNAQILQRRLAER